MKRSACKKILAGLLACTLTLLSAACNIVPNPSTRTTTESSDDATTATTHRDQPTTPGTQPATTPATQETTPQLTSHEPSAGDPDEETPTEVMLPDEEVKVVGINLLCNADSVDSRAPQMIELLTSTGADSIGVQECMGKWETWLEEGLGDKYARMGVDCLGNQNAQSFATYVYYLKEKYVAVDSGTFWMSKTPDTPSKYGDMVDMNRTCTWVILENIETGFRYVHMNCHLDWWDLDVNAIQCAMIRNQMERFAALGYPVFATGDYNSGEMTDSYAVMTDSDVVADSRYIAADTTDMISHPGNGKTIDYCHVTKAMMDVLKFDVLDTQANGAYLSDHRGIYVHARVKSLPRQDMHALTPSFTDTAEITRVSSTASSIEIRFPQAKDADGNVAYAYLLEVTDANGKTVVSETISGGLLTPTPPEAITHSFIVPAADTYYTVRITPVSFFGNVSTPLVQWVYCEDNVEPIEVGAPDLLDMKVQNGVVVDLSGQDYEIETFGTVTVEGDSFSVSENGNLKIAAFKEHYDALADGFAIAVIASTSSDVSKQCIASNMHAGGYGFIIEDGYLSFQVYANGAYQKAKTAIAPNTTYHLVGVYDPSTGVLLYVNGKLAAIVSLSSDANMSFASVDSAKYLCIGADSDEAGDGEYSYRGTITHVGVYSDPLSAGNALYLYQNQ